MPPSSPDLLTLQVRHRQALAEDIVAFELQDPGGAELPAFDAGAHIDLHLPGATPQGPARVRSYSLCNAPGERHRYLIAVQCERQGRGGSRWLHEQLQVGHLLQVSRPRNCFALRPAPHTLLLAGGIGLTPLLAMAETLWAQARSFELHIAVRSEARLPFALRLLQSPWRGCVQLHVDDHPDATRWHLPALLAGQPPGTVAHACGPAGFMAAVQRAAHQVGWRDEQVVIEHFAAPASAPAATASGAADSFELHWAPTGQCLSVPPQHSVAQVLQAAGIAVSLSCEQGICGQCCLRVLDGEPEHRDLVYGAHEHEVEGLFTPCCSRARSPRLVLAPLDWHPLPTHSLEDAAIRTAPALPAQPQETHP